MGAPGEGAPHVSAAETVDLEEIGVKIPNTTARPDAATCTKRPCRLDRAYALDALFLFIAFLR
jgi:hypothetical protein